jgi:hypothetical protein
MDTSDVVGLTVAITAVVLWMGGVTLQLAILTGMVCRHNDELEELKKKPEDNDGPLPARRS